MFFLHSQETGENIQKLKPWIKRVANNIQRTENVHSFKILRTVYILIKVFWVCLKLSLWIIMLDCCRWMIYLNFCSVHQSFRAPILWKKYLFWQFVHWTISGKIMKNEVKIDCEILFYKNLTLCPYHYTIQSSGNHEWAIILTVYKIVGRKALKCIDINFTKCTEHEEHFY